MFYFYFKKNPMKKRIKTLIGTGKTEKQYKKQAKRWFGRNPNRKVILMKTDAGEKRFTREQILAA